MAREPSKRPAKALALNMISYTCLIELVPRGIVVIALPSLSLSEFFALKSPPTPISFPSTIQSVTSLCGHSFPTNSNSSLVCLWFY